MSKYLLIFILLGLLLAFRIEQNGGLSQPERSEPELEALAANFTPWAEDLAQKITDLLPQPQAGLLAGMVLGVKSSLPPEFKQALTNTSTIHIVVVSGQNLTLLSGFILGFVGFFGRKKTILISLFTVLFYSLLTGLQIPVMRAAIMVILASAAQLFNREGEGWWVLSLTALLMLLYQPNWLLSISFQLSFMATIAVVILAPALEERLKFLPEFIKQDLVVSFSAQLLTFPIIAANFNEGSLAGVLVNSLVLWTVPIIMISGIVAIMALMVSPFLAQILVLLPGVFLTYFVYIVTFFNQDWSSLYIPNVSPLVWVGYYLIILGIYLKVKSKNKVEDEKGVLGRDVGMERGSW